MARIVLHAVAGLLFALGLAVSGMTDPKIVLGFLDVTGQFNPALLLVMTGALAVYAPSYWILTHRRKRPFFGSSFDKPSKSKIDFDLLGGAFLFGIGWGLAGYCPGPSLVAFAAGAKTALLFVPAMLVGMALFAAVNQTRSGQKSK